MSLRADGAGFAYPGSPVSALKSISVKIVPGEILLVAGRAGSGKSTLMKLLAGLIEPNAGTVLLDSQPPTPHKIGIVFQDPASQLFADTVEADLMFGPRNLGKSDEECRKLARESLELVGLDPHAFLERSPFSLSGGQARRVAIAGVLAMDPEYLIFDEPTAGLDAQGRAFVKELLTKLKGRNRAVVVVTHDLDELLPCADNLLLLEGGRLAWNGPVRHAVNRPGIFGLAGLTEPDLLQFQACVARLSDKEPRYTLDPERAVDNAFEAFGIAARCADASVQATPNAKEAGDR